MLYCLLIACSMVLWLANTADAATYWVAKTGNDSRSCAQAQSSSTPRRSIAAGLTCLSPGDTLIVRAGTYSEGNLAIPSGGGSEATRIIVKAENSGAVTIMPPPGAETIGDPISWITLDGLIIDAQNNSRGLGLSGNHVRVKNTEIKNARDQGIIVSHAAGSQFLELIDVTIHDVAWPPGQNKCHGCDGHSDCDGYCHGVYGGSDDNLYDRVNIYRCNGYGIQLYTSGNRNIIRNSRFHDSAPLWIRGDSNQVYNNLFYGHPYSAIGMDGASNLKMYNNTFYGNGNFGIDVQSSSNLDGRNNLFIQNGGGSISTSSGWSTLSNNLCNGGGSTIGCTLSGNPNFQNGAGGDFHLDPGSAAIDAGTTISLVTTDFDKVPRPQGARFDIGAYEYTGSPPIRPSAPTNFRIISQ